MWKRRDPLDRSARKWLTYRRILSTKGVFREGVAFTCLSPIKKAKQPHTSISPAPSARSFVRALLPACSYIPAPVSHSRVFSLPSAHDPRLCFFARPRARSEPLRSRFVPTPSGVWFLRFVPALALSPCPSPVSHSRVFGSPESAFFPAPSAPSSPFLGAALTYT